MKEIYLDASRLHDKESMSTYMKEVFSLPEESGNNLDAISDSLSEVEEEMVVVVNDITIEAIAREEYSLRFLEMLLDACGNNPHLHIRYQENEPIA